MGIARGLPKRSAPRSRVEESLRTSNEVALLRRIQLEALVALISRRLLSASAEALDDEIVWALGEIGLFADAERSFLYRCERDLEIWENTHEWHALAVPSLPPGARQVKLSNYPWSFKKLQLGQVVRFSAHNLPPEASGERDWLRHGEMGAALVLPLMVRGQLVGCLGLNTTRSDEQWQEEDLDCLRTASEIILQALDRQRADRHQARQAQRLNAQNAVLEMIARGRPLTEVLTALARLVEDECPACASMLLLVDDLDPSRLRPTAFGPNMPATMVEAMKLVPIAPQGAIGGLAAFGRRQVTVPSIALDENFAPHCAPALQDGFQACTCIPIISRSGALLGSFALYFKDAAGLVASIQPLADSAASLAAVAIDHWQNEQRTVRANEALVRLVENAPIAIVSLGRDRQITGWNPAASKIFGFTAEEAIGRTMTELMVSPEQQADHESRWAQLTHEHMLAGAEATRTRKDGSPVEIAYWTSLITSPSGEITGVISFIAEITEQKKLKDQLLRSSRMESIGRLAGGVAHDFNNLLAVISGYSESMLRRTDAVHPLRNHIEEIYRAATRGAALTQQLLAFSRRQRIEPRSMDISQAVQNVYAMLRRVITDRIEIILDTPREVEIIADPGQMEQVLVNLSINARDAMADGGTLTLATRNIKVSEPIAGGPKPGEYGHLAITDTGVGMSAKTAARIFEPFFTTKLHPKEGGGTGLGLSIVYGIIQQAGGHIAVQSAPGEGTRFDIYIPSAASGVRR